MMQLTLTIDDRATQKLLAFQKGNARFASAIVRGISRASQEIVGIAIREHFTGKGPFPVSENKLGVITGRLRRSIRATSPLINSDSSELSIDYGSNVSYFGLHEFGFNGRQQVKGHTRSMAGKRNFSRGKLTKASTKRLKGILAKRHFDQKGKLTSYVRPHTRKVNIPARAPLGTVLRSARATSLYFARIDDEIFNAIKRLS